MIIIKNIQAYTWVKEKETYADDNNDIWNDAFYNFQSYSLLKQLDFSLYLHKSGIELL